MSNITKDTRARTAVVVCSKGVFPDKAGARQWAIDAGFRVDRFEETARDFRFVQQPYTDARSLVDAAPGVTLHINERSRSPRSAYTRPALGAATQDGREL